MSLAALYNDNHEAWTTASASIAFFVFILVITYHAIYRLPTLKKVQHTKSCVTITISRWIKREKARDLRQREGKSVHVIDKVQDITHTSVELYSPLL